MNGLDSPLEALAFNPVNLGPLLAAVINNLWALVAVVTAAVISFRHLRSSVSKVVPETTTVATPLLSTSTFEIRRKAQAIITLRNYDDDDDNAEEEEVEEERGVVLTRGNSKNKFFTAYYEEEERENDQEEEEEEEGCVGDDVDGGDVAEEDDREDEMMIKKWDVVCEESTVEMRRGGELGWYGYQDRGVIDGSVVRLWGGERDRSCSCSPRGGSKLRKVSSFGVVPFVLA